MDKVYYRGDTFTFPFTLEDVDGKPINFELGDILKCAVKRSINCNIYSLYKDIQLERATDKITIDFTSEETQTLTPAKDYIVELELTRGKYTTTVYQDTIIVKGDVINNVSKVKSDT